MDWATSCSQNEFRLINPVTAEVKFYKDFMRHRRTTWHENAVQRSIEETGQSVVQASLEGDCLEVGLLPVRAQIPL